MPARSHYRKGRLPPFAPIPHALQDDQDATPFHISAYAAIQRFTDYGGEVGAAVSDATAARKARMSPRQFRRCRDWLKKCGWLEWQANTGQLNKYVIHATVASQAGVPVATPAPQADPPRPNRPRGPAPQADNQEPATKNQKPRTGLKDKPATFAANDLLALVIDQGLSGHRPPGHLVGRQAAVAKRLVESGAIPTRKIAVEAIRGMRLLYPWAPPDAKPFDVLTLERKLTEALAEAAGRDKLPSNVYERAGRPGQGHAPRGGEPTRLSDILPAWQDRVIPS